MAGNVNSGRKAEPKMVPPGQVVTNWEDHVPPENEGWHSLAKEHHRRLAPMMARRGYLNQAHWLGWSLLMSQYSTWLQISEDMEGKLVAQTEKGSKYLNPLFSVQANAFKSMFLLAKEFGMTPTSQAGLRWSYQDQEKSDLAMLMETGDLSHGNDETADQSAD